MITQVTITNFKAIKQATLDLTPLHLLIGPNDSGKTSVLEAIAAICRSVDHTATESFLGRWQGRELVFSGSDDANLSINIQARDDSGPFLYGVAVEFPTHETSRAHWGLVSYKTGPNTALDLKDDKDWTISAKKHRYMPVHPSTTVELLEHSRRVSDTLWQCWYIRWSARNLALPVALNPRRRFRIEGNGFGLATLIDDLLNYDRESFANLEREFVGIFPNVRSIALVQQAGFDSPVDQADETLKLNTAPGKQITFRLKDSKHDLPASQAAEGMLYVLGYLALMYLPEPPRVLLIEEPENGIHPNRVGDIVRILRRLVERHPETQVVLTSHSPYLVDAFEPQEVTWCHRNTESGEVELTRLDTIPEVQRGLKVFSLGEIWTGELEPQPAETE
ncbi:MAG: AAA family ATPase [Planctomycetaceae bacterium]|nr:AAA family ATPase [Planctomycetaceae bacterium]MCB9951804.1 AAA family ATPase [Planctomycetaceae bacterium]